MVRRGMKVPSLVNFLKVVSVSPNIDSGRGFLTTHARRRCHLFNQKSIPAVVFKKAMRPKKGMQTAAMVIAKYLKKCSAGMLVMPKTEVTKVIGKKKMDAYEVKFQN
jgi:hypothetical protein